MNYGFYQSAAGLMSQINRLQIASNNLANSETVGFKADRVTTAQRLPARLEAGLAADPQVLLEALGGGQLADPTRFDLAQGSLTPTTGDLNLAIDGPGFFLVGNDRADEESLRLTRDGRLTRDPEGHLAMVGTGLKVLDERRRPVSVPLGPVAIGADGLVTQGDRDLGRIALMEVSNPSGLRKIGDSLIATTAESGRLRVSPDSTLWQGYLESSSVKPVLEMTGLVRISRALEANATLMQAQDVMSGQMINTFGKVT